MTTETRKLLLQIFLETTNLVVLTIFLVVIVLTRDWWLSLVAANIEAAYLCCGCWLPALRSRLKTRMQSRPVVQPADCVLLLVSVAGFVVIFFFGFGKHLLNHPFPNLTHAAGWEAGALIWTALFLFYYLIKFSFTGNTAIDKLIVVILAGLSVWLITQAWHSMEHPIEHVFYVLSISACFFVIDLLLWQQHPDPKEQQLSRASFWWADTPMVVAFTILLCYLFCHRDIEYPEVFASGVVSCQLLISNAIFIAMEFGLLQHSEPISVGQLSAPQRAAAARQNT